MGKTSVRKRIKQFWQALTIKKKIATFTGTVFLIIAVSVLFNVWVVKFSLIDFNRILQDNAAVSELAQALEEESIQFETYIKGNREERESLDIAIERTGRAVEKLPFRYSEIGEQRYAKTWSIKSCYEVYCQKRDAMLAMGENAPDYIKRLYEVYEMQDYLEEYAATLMNETIEDGDGLYHKKVPMLICMPIVVVVSGIILVTGMMELAALMNQTIISPVVALVKAAQRIRDAVPRILEKIRRILHQPAVFLQFLEKYGVGEVLGAVKNELFNLLGHYRPRRFVGYLKFGTGDPAQTGELTGALYLLLPTQEYEIVPDFEETQFETETELEGQIRSIHLLVTAYHLFRNKKLKRLIRKLRKKGE